MKRNSRLSSAVIGLLACIAMARNSNAQEWVARHGLSTAEYQAAFDDLAKKGLRLVSVSAYVSGGSERFAAHWVRRAGPEWYAKHNLSAADYQTAFNDFFQRGFRLTWINGCELGGQTRYAAIWEKRSGPAWEARHGLTATQFQQEFDTLTRQGYRLVHVSGYASGGSARYAAIFEKSGGPAWQARHGLTTAQYQSAFDTLASQGYRLKLVSGYQAGGADQYAAIWEKAAGPPWAARHGVPDSWYQNVFDNFFYQGYRPAYVNAFTSGGAGKINTIWENTSFSGSDLALIQSKARAYLNTYQAPGLALAIMKDGRLVYASGAGYANKESGEEAGPTSLFRVASVSKPITSVAIMKLVEAHKLSLDDHVFGPSGILRAKYPTPAGNKRIEKIRVRHLLGHVSGLSNSPFDPMFHYVAYNHDALIALVLGDPARVDARDPGTVWEYMNFGYCLLGRVIEQKSGQRYEDYVTKNVLAPSGITDMTIAGNTPAARKPREVAYYPATEAYSLNVSRMDSHGGWIASPIDLLRFLARVDGSPGKPDILAGPFRTLMITPLHVKDASGNDPNYGFGWAANPQAHNGAMSGTIAILQVAQNGFAYAAVVNTRPAGDQFPDNLAAMVQSAINGVSAWPPYDLF